MTLNKWLILMALIFGSFQAMASLSSGPQTRTAAVASERATMSYGETLANQFPSYGLQLRDTSSALSADDIQKIQLELLTFEEAMKTSNPDATLMKSKFQYIACGVPCGCPRTGCGRANSFSSSASGN